MAYDDVLHDAAQAEKARIRAMTTPTDDELRKIIGRINARLWQPYEAIATNEEMRVIVRALTERLTSQSRDDVEIPRPVYDALIAWQRWDYNAGETLQTALDEHMPRALKSATK